MLCLIVLDNYGNKSQIHIKNPAYKRQWISRPMRIDWSPRNHPKLLSQKSWHLGIRNGPIARVFWILNQSIEQKVKNLRLEKCRYIKDIKVTLWDTAQYFDSKQLRKSIKKICSLKFVRVGYKRQTSFFQINIVTCSFMPASPNLLGQLSYI